ncbi:PREDICTED: vitamin K-dependent protein C-like [Papilio xuthus]|uniref:Vitamin K-dependent protein C-like n=1 Tax=Papilio xuthus TaxID=66420 RepID=A0AAJ6Z1Y2_PAPXU|nr:PREDICTED: vitamin K-dependent protein C-like [Papilio xuthus]
MPIADVLLHPEYKHFGVKSSVALLKLLTPLASNYMVPVCLPFRNFMLRPFKDYVEKLIYVDFVSEVPRDFLEEEKELVYLRMVPRERCIKHDNANESGLLPERHVCTTGCDLQSGAPTLVHEHTGHWNLFAMAEGGAPCPDPLRSRGPGTPSRHILMNPYVPWITTAISGQAIGSFSKDDPFGKYTCIL